MVYQDSGGRMSQDSCSEGGLVPGSSFTDQDSQYCHPGHGTDSGTTSRYPGQANQYCHPGKQPETVNNSGFVPTSHHPGSLYSHTHPVSSSSHPSHVNSSSSPHPLNASSQSVISGDSCPLFPPLSQCQTVNHMTRTVNGPCHPETSCQFLESQSLSKGQDPCETGEIEVGQGQIANQRQLFSTVKWSDNTLDMVSSLEQSDNTWLRTSAIKGSGDNPSDNPSDSVIHMPSDTNHFLDSLDQQHNPSERSIQMPPDINPHSPYSPINPTNPHRPISPKEIPIIQQLSPSHYGPVVSSQFIYSPSCHLDTGDQVIICSNSSRNLQTGSLDKGDLYSVLSERKDLLQVLADKSDLQAVSSDGRDLQTVLLDRNNRQKVLLDRRDIQPIISDRGDHLQPLLSERRDLKPILPDQPAPFSLQASLYLTDYSGRCQCGSPLNFSNQSQELSVKLDNQSSRQQFKNNKQQLLSNQNNKQQSHTTDV